MPSKPFVRLVLIACLAGLSGAPSFAQSAAAGPKATIANFEDMKAARAALDELIRAYESGDIGLIQTRLDPAMIGYQRFIDGMRRDVTGLKQIRLHLFATQVTAGPDVAMIQAAWEKRFFGVASFTPGLFTGRSSFLMHRDKDGWRLAAVSGDNPFSSESGVLAILAVAPAGIAASGLPPCPGALPISIELVDPDLAGLTSITVEVSSNQGEREGVVLAQISPGRFRQTTLPVCRVGAAPSRGNGQIEVRVPLIQPATLSVRYIDANPGADRPPATLIRSVTVR